MAVAQVASEQKSKILLPPIIEIAPPTLSAALLAISFVPILALAVNKFEVEAVVAKKLVVVAEVEVEFEAVKFWRVVEEVVRNPPEAVT